MTAPNHIVGGLAFVGIFAAISNINILEKPAYIILTIFAALLPDIDHTKSIIGKLFYPLAKWINRHYGHRTITHTLLFLITGTIITAIIERNFLTDHHFSKIFFLAYLSHLIFDMMTVQGVPLFFPFSRNPCVLPANPDKRFRTGNIRTETMIFSFFTLSAVFCYPLMQNGFWMQYNRQFGTLTHLAKQYRLSKNILKVEYTYRAGSEAKKGAGYCIEASETKTILFNSETNSFISLDKKLTALKLYPTETKKTLTFKTERFNNTTIEAVNAILKNKNQPLLLQKADITANKPFLIIENQIPTNTNSYTKNYPNPIQLQTIPTEQIIPFQSNPKINQLQKRIAQKRANEAVKQANYQRQLAQLEQLKAQLSTADLSEKERLMTEIRTTEKTIKTPVDKSNEIKLLEIELATLRQSQQIERTIYNQENKTEELKLTGNLIKIIIE